MGKGTEIFSLSGKTAQITGATGYLGSSMAIDLAEAGAHILINSRSKERSNAMVKLLVDYGYTAETAVFDVTEQQAIDGFFLARKKLPLYILIINAYIGGSVSSQFSKVCGLYK